MGKRLEDDLLSNKPVEMPEETIGTCNRCFKIGELGDGFCLKCWDKGSRKGRDYKKPSFQSRLVRPRIIER